MGKMHTDDSFMYNGFPIGDAMQKAWENQMLDDYETPADMSSVETDPLVNRITHQRGPKAPSTECIMNQYEEVDWTKAPWWANFWARDMDGECRWYDSKPLRGASRWRPRVACDWTEQAPDFNVKARGWVETLNERIQENTPNFDLRDEQEQTLDDLVRNAEELDLYDDEIVHDLTKPLSQQIGGEHYRQGDIQPIEYIHANDMDFFSGNVVKYITRWKYKSGLEDLKKAKHYIELLIEQEYGSE